MTIDDLAQEIRRVDGNHDLGAGALAEALMPYLRARSSAPEAREGAVLDAAAAYLKQQYGASHGLDHPTDRERILSSIPAAPSADKLRIAMDAFDAITDLSTALRNGGPDSSDLQDLSDNLNTAVDLANEALAALKAEGA